MMSKVLPKKPKHDAGDTSAASGNNASIQAQLIPLMQASRQGYALFDAQDKLRFANPAFRKALGLSREELPIWTDFVRQAYRQAVGMDIPVAEHEFESWLQAAQSRRGKMPYRSFETRLKDGRWVMMTETIQPDGWMLCVMTDISSLGEDWRTLKHERDAALRAMHADNLTGLSNHRYALSWLEGQLGVTKITSLSAIVLDLDRFRRLNDTYGHDKGDKVLSHFGAQLLALAQAHELAARLDGAQFLLVLNDKPLQLVESMLTQLLQTLAQTAPLYERPDLRYTCSAGVALALPGEMPRNLLNRADQALRQAKREGGNKYVVAE